LKHDSTLLHNFPSDFPVRKTTIFVASLKVCSISVESLKSHGELVDILYPRIVMILLSDLGPAFVGGRVSSFGFAKSLRSNQHSLRGDSIPDFC
jgi:hypothetical protein